MGKAKRLKQERRERREQGETAASPPGRPPAVQAPQGKARAPVLVTLTREPFQPVRLYYTITDRAAVVELLTRLRCVEPNPEEPGGFGWNLDEEAQKLKIGEGWRAVPKEARPVVLGRIRFPDEHTMTLTVGSVDRALAAASFFAPRLGSAARLSRCRVVNRLFPAESAALGGPRELQKTLDENVTVIDPAEREARIREKLERLQKSNANPMLTLMQEEIDSGEDVPAVEDFPADPVDTDFTSLSFTLQLRAVRAMQHWLGHTEVTLPRLLMGMAGGGKGLPGLKL